MIPNIIVHVNAGLRKMVANVSEYHSLVIIIFIAVIIYIQVCYHNHITTLINTLLMLLYNIYISLIIQYYG